MTEASTKQWDDVVDLLGADYAPPIRDMDDPDEARRRIEEYLGTRLSAVLDSYPGRPVLMLSGGIDSTTIAGALKKLRADPLCVTVAVADSQSADRDRAASVAACLGFEHLAVEVSREEAVAAAVEAAQDLGTDEIWEVGAAVTIRLAVGAAGGRGGGVLTGMGADVLFAGGATLAAPLLSNTARLELRERIWEEAQREFTIRRLVPDYYECVLGSNAKRLVHVFQTLEAWHLTADFGPGVLFADRSAGGIVDKCCLRDLAVEFGVDRDLVWAPKAPLQQSSGIMDALEQHGREYMASNLADRAYGDPRTESAETVIARMGLREAVRESSGSEDSIRGSQQETTD